MYQLNPGDRIDWAVGPWGDRILWMVGEKEDGDLSWIPQLGANLVIAESSYWDRIAYADCYCGHDGNMGFTLVVDAITGAILRYSPGVNCVFC